jgi:hypothetical protein
LPLTDSIGGVISLGGVPLDVKGTGSRSFNCRVNLHL